ncbi:MAG: GNAT family N-acetyltransferase [Proteobacteria bacterium]|nr:GNAT family N-acetyltransferase [Pseudomonadota bacterium]
MVACSADGLASPAAIASWDAIAQWASEPNPFYESWFLLPAVRQFAATHQASLLRFELDEHFAGLMPLCHAPRYYGWPVPVMGNWLHPNCFLGAPLVSAGTERLFWRALFDWADLHCQGELFLHLQDLPLDGPLHQALVDELADQQRQAALVRRRERVVLRSPLGSQAYWEASISAKKRKELRRQANRLAELGRVGLQRQRDAAGLEQWIGQFLALEAAGWKGAAGTALECAAETRILFSEALHGAAAGGRLERLTLALDGTPVAMLANFITGPGVFSFKTTFDEKLSAYSPGVLLQQANLGLLDDPVVRWSDSCAYDDHPMIAHLWRERRPFGSYNIAIGGRARRFAFAQFARIELARSPLGGPQ